MDAKRMISPKVLVLLITTTALVLVLTACGRSAASQGTADNVGGTTANTDSKVSTTTIAPTAPLAGGDGQTAVSNATQLLQSQKAYRVRTTSVTSMGGQPTTGLREFVSPDRMHNIEDGQEIIVIGKTMYVKKGSEWRNMGTQMSDMTEKMKEGIQQMTAEERAQATKGLTADYKSLGDEILDGTPTAVYELHSRMDTQVEGVGSITFVTKYWIGKSDGLIRKEETNGDEAGITIKTTRIYEYDPDIKIEAPIS